MWLGRGCCRKLWTGNLREYDCAGPNFRYGGGFRDAGGGMHIVYLTASRVPDEWAAFVDRLRAKLIGFGCHLGPFQLHVTLVRVPAGSIGLEDLRRRIGRVDAPELSSTLAKADYRFYREFKWAVREWTLSTC